MASIQAGWRLADMGFDRQRCRHQTRKDFTMLSIQTNVNSLIAQQNLNINNEFQARPSSS